MKNEREKVASLIKENQSLRITIKGQREIIQQLHLDIDMMTEILEELNWHIQVQDEKSNWNIEGNEIPFHLLN